MDYDPCPTQDLVSLGVVMPAAPQQPMIHPLARSLRCGPLLYSVLCTALQPLLCLNIHLCSQNPPRSDLYPFTLSPPTPKSHLHSPASPSKPLSHLHGLPSWSAPSLTSAPKNYPKSGHSTPVHQVTTQHLQRPTPRSHSAQGLNRLPRPVDTEMRPQHREGSMNSPDGPAHDKKKLEMQSMIKCGSGSAQGHSQWQCMLLPFPALQRPTGTSIPCGKLPRMTPKPLSLHSKLRRRLCLMQMIKGGNCKHRACSAKLICRKLRCMLRYLFRRGH